MKDKYYQPDISEFHIGFEYEYNPEDDQWNKHIMNSPTPIPNLTDFVPKYFRVKYLDREDIESLGFIQKPNDERVFMMYLKETAQPIFLNTGWSSIVSPDKQTTVISAPKMDESKMKILHENFLFNGTIKNKSVLKQVLKMIGV